MSVDSRGLDNPMVNFLYPLQPNYGYYHTEVIITIQLNNSLLIINHGKTNKLNLTTK